MPDKGNTNQRIGFIGLGAMGLPMAINLSKAGYSVSGYDIATARIETFEASGGRGSKSASDAAADADLLMLMVATADQADSVLFGPAGAAAALPGSAPVVLFSTVSPVYVRSLEKRLAECRRRLLDAPVSGGTDGAKTARLTVMASGPRTAYQAAAGALEAIATQVYHLGDRPGIGSTVKMVNQLLVGVYAAVSAEAMALGVRAGIDPTVLYEVISKSAGRSFVFNQRAQRMIRADYTPSAALDIFVKDLALVLEAGRTLNFPTPMAAAAHQLFITGSSAGFGKEDDAALVKVFEKIAGIRVSDR